MIGAVFAAALMFQSLVPAERSALERPEALAPVAERLSERGGRPVNILIIGDSHSAADHISGALRERLQARYGATGRGVLQPALPFAGASIRQATLTYDGVSALQGGDAGQGAGLTGFVGRAQPGAVLSLNAEPGVAFDRLSVCFLAEAGAGELTLDLGGAQRTVFAGDGYGPRCETIESRAPTAFAQLRISGGPVRLFSWAAQRASGGGVSVSNLGVIGAQVSSLLSRDRRVIEAEMAAYRPDLILLAFGTNEGFDDGVDPADYAATYREALMLLRGVAPGAAIVAVGPPDAATLRPDLYRRGGFDRYDLCFPLSDAERADYARLRDTRDPVLARWYAPPSLSVVREIQRRTAREMGVAFWDWEARMGGPCSIDRMLRSDPPAARSDHVHFNTTGGALIGGWLADDLIAAFDRESR